MQNSDEIRKLGQIVKCLDSHEIQEDQKTWKITLQVFEGDQRKENEVFFVDFQDPNLNHEILEGTIGTIAYNELMMFVTLHNNTEADKKEITKMGKEIASCEERIRTNLKKIRESESTKAELQEETEKLDRKHRALKGFVLPKDRESWKDSLKEQKVPIIQLISTIEEKVIKRLDHFYMWNGRAKATEIRKALRDAVEHAAKQYFIRDEKNTMTVEDFLDYRKESDNSLFSTQKEKNNISLREALGIHRLGWSPKALKQKSTHSQEEIQVIAAEKPSFS